MKKQQQSPQKLTRLITLAASAALILSACVPLQTKQSPKLTQQEAILETPIQQIQPEPQKTDQLINHNFEGEPTSEELAQQPVKTNLWTRIRNDMRLQHCSSEPEAEKWAKWYANHPEYLERIQKRAEPILWYITEQVEKRNLPGEIILLPVVESAFYPFSYSHGQAAGLWQFVPGTAKDYGLKINWWLDERRDLIKSTNAGLDYLQALGKQFDNDWILALASYNSGPGRVSREIKRLRRLNRQTSFKHLKLPKETRAYVPKLLGISCVIRDPEHYQITLLDIEDKAQTELVNTDGQIDLAIAAELAEIELDQLYALNPGFNRWATSPEHTQQLLLPIENATRFNEKLAQLPKNERLTWERIEIKKGDTPIGLAKKYNITAQLLLEINQIDNPKSLRAGRFIMVPHSGKDVQYKQSLDARMARIKSMPRGKQRVVYVVKPGDSFWKIARQYKITTRQLASWNGMSPKDTLRVGNKLSIWNKKPLATLSSTQMTQSQASIPTQRVNYRVRQGDSLWKIARKFNVHISQIKKWNKLGQTNHLKPGQALTIWVNVTQVASNT
ncbi:MAG: LysM peptidoglycan-binding domain-containing protein [bacterium]